MEPFSEHKINKLFKCSSNPLKIISRESSTVEFKENFSIIALYKYAKTMSAFANKDGGYLIFGVKNNPRLVVGLIDNSFDDFDDEKFSEKLNTHFAPEIVYEKTTINYCDYKIGLIYTYPAKNKPVICKTSYNSGSSQLLREGAIYYRYYARTSEIKYADLLNLLNENLTKERNAWLNTFTKMATIGVNNLSILDLTNGELLYNTGNEPKIFVDNNLLSQIKFIKEGEFTEKTGAPTLRVIGDVKDITGAIVKPSKIVKKVVPTNITEKYLLQTFINQTGTLSPLSYIEAICLSAVKYLPFYYFAYLEQLANPKFDKKILKLEISKITEDSKQGKRFLLERIKSDDSFKEEKLNVDSDECRLKKKYYDLFINHKTKLEDIPDENIDYQLKIILNIKDKEQLKNLIIPLLKKYIEVYYEEHKNLLRRAASYIDKELYFEFI